MFYVGIDWAKESHQVHITDDSGKTLREFKVTNNYEGLHKLLEILRGLSSDISDILIGIETSTGILFEFLLDNGYTIYPLNPSVVDKFRSRYRISRTKTDPIDAMTIANIIRTDRHHYRPALANSPLCRKIRLLARDRKSLMEEKTKIQLQLQECLKLYYPVSLDLFYGTDSKKFIDFIKENPSLDDARKLSLSKLRVFLRKHCTSPSEAEKIYEKIHSPQIEISPFITEAKKRYSVALVDLFENILNQIKAYDKEIAMLVEEHPYQAIFLSLPGVKHNLGSRLLGEIGDNLSQYKDYNSLQSYAGTAPVSFFSGKLRKTVRRRKACNKHLRNTLHLMAFSSLMKSKWAREFYSAQKNKGKPHNQALRSVANKWVKIIYALLKNNTVYDEDYHLKNKQGYINRCEKEEVLVYS